jgi:hypothetical protein
MATYKAPSQAKADAIASAEAHIREEQRAIDICHAHGLMGFDLKTAQSELAHFQALLARLTTD